MAESFQPVAGVLSYFARHRTAANLLLAILVAAGVAAFPRMRAQFFPDVVVESVDVRVAWEGAGAEDVDGAIVQVLEPALLGIEGVESSESTSREGRASIELEFEPGWDMARAAADAQAVADAATDLPEDAEDPSVRRNAWRDRVTDVVIVGQVDPEQLGGFADEFVSRLFAEGVTRTTIRGVASPETVVEVPSLSLIRHDLTMAEIAEAIGAEAEADPAGEIAGANARVRTGDAKVRADEIAAIVLRSGADGSSLTVGDVGRVVVGGVDRELAYFVGENPAISIRVDRSEQGDAIAIQRQVEEVAAEMERTLPETVGIDLIRTRAEAISGRLRILLENGLLGLGLVVALLFLFLNARTAFWVAAGIPVAMTATFAIMHLMGLTLNMISLFALLITLGIVVDDAIVVGEHADHRARRGEGPYEAAENAASRMFQPVLAATLTTIIAFFGLVAIGGRFGDLIVDIPLTVIVVLIASLIECFLILPNHMAHSLRHSATERWYDLPSRIVNRGFRRFRETIFRRLVAGVVFARYPVIAFAILLLAWQMSLFVRGDLQWRFFNAPERGSVTGNFAMASGATRDDALAMTRELQRAADAVAARYEERYGVDPLDYVVVQVGGVAGRGLAGAETKDADQLGSISIELIDADLRPYSSFQFVAELQGETRGHPLVETLSFRGWRSGPGGDALDIHLFGADAGTLKEAAEDLKSRLSGYPEVSGLEDSLAYDKEELVLELTAQGRALGFAIDGLGRALRNRLNGIEAATYPEGVRSGAIRVELPEREQTADFLDRIRMRASSGQYVALADIVSVESRTGFSEVRRVNGLRLVSVTGDVSEDDPARATEIMTALQETILPAVEERHGVSSRMSGLAEQESEFLNDGRAGFILCMLGIFMCLAWTFSSWTRPLVVMAVIPFGLVGCFYGHALWNVPLSMFSVIGLIGMTGIIINDSIILVRTVDEYAEERGLIPAIVDGTADRLRAVMLTTATTVLGLAPLLYEKSQQAQFLKPTVITLVYGLGFGMILVLLVVPALLAAKQDATRQFASLRRALMARGRAPAVAAATMAALVAVAALFAATLGSVVLTGGLPSALSPSDDGPAPLAKAFALFVGGAGAILVVAYLAAALTFFVLRRRSGA